MAYTKNNNFTNKDSTNAPVLGSEFDQEFDEIESEMALLAPLDSPTLTGTVDMPVTFQTGSSQFITGAQRIAVVASLPGSPDANTLYFVTS